MFLRYSHAQAFISSSLTSLPNSIILYKAALCLFIFLLMNVKIVSNFKILLIITYDYPYIFVLICMSENFYILREFSIPRRIIGL